MPPSQCAILLVGLSGLKVTIHCLEYLDLRAGIHIFANQGIIFSLSVLFKMTMLKLPKKVVEDS